MLQDGPPLGGFTPMRYVRRITNKGPSTITIFLTAFGAFSWAMYQVDKGKIRRPVQYSVFCHYDLILLGFDSGQSKNYVPFF